jgi:hypothetical protein
MDGRGRAMVGNNRGHASSQRNKSAQSKGHTGNSETSERSRRGEKKTGFGL